jgi:DNA-binding response OmpR family regulator
MQSTVKTLVPQLMGSREPASLFPESSVYGQRIGAKSLGDHLVSQSDPPKVPRVFPESSERREVPNRQGEFSFGRVTVNFLEMSVHREGKPIVLTAMEFKVLEYFIQNPRRVISRAELLNRVWGYENYIRTRTVDNHILRLRQKLEENPDWPTHIRTVYRAGYKFLP